jgi:hypothetical protein
VTIIGVLTRNKNLDLLLIRSDGYRNHSVALAASQAAAIRTILLFTNKTVNRKQVSGLVAYLRHFDSRCFG